MTIRILALSTLLTALLLAAGCIGGDDDVAADPAPNGSAVAAAVAEADPTTLEWAGYIRVGAADRFAHSTETEPLIEPLAKMGFNLEVPDGTTGLEFRLAWPAGAWTHFVVHGPDDAGMPTYMMNVPEGGEACIRVPDEDVVPGVWKAMAHASEDADSIEFTITSIVTGPPGAQILEGPHGHPTAGMAMMMTMGMDMEMREPAECLSPDGS